MNKTKEILDRFLNKEFKFTFYNHTGYKKHNIIQNGFLIKVHDEYFLLHNDSEFMGATPSRKPIKIRFKFNYSWTLGYSGSGCESITDSFKFINKYNKRMIRVTI